MSAIFSVTRTTAVTSKKNDRTDIRMPAQHRIALIDQRTRLQAALIKDYNTTVGSRDDHSLFLTMMLSQVQKYHMDAFDQVIPPRALEILAERNADMMMNEECDQYAMCLAHMGHRRLYTRGFIDVAAQMVAEEEALRRLQEAQRMSDSVTSSGGLSDE